jgi:proteasome lid subunit RPN8/RPN11
MRISRELYDEIVAHAHQEAPNECVGIVAARDGEAVKVFRAENEFASPLKFKIPDAEQLRIHNELWDTDLEIGAIYHSHTRTDPEPSPTDMIYAELWPGVLWIIVGLSADRPPVVRTWRIENGTVGEDPLVVM